MPAKFLINALICTMDKTDKPKAGAAKKIPLCRVHEEVHSANGFSSGGCINSECKDLCCMGGAEFDRRSHELVIEHWGRIKQLIGKDMPPEECFEGKWLNDSEYVGNNAVDSKVDPMTGYCIFHLPSGKGCSLFRLVFSEGLPKGLIPSICRLFPVTWDKGALIVTPKSDIPPTCECISSKKKRLSLFETQRHAIEDIFELPE